MTRRQLLQSAAPLFVPASVFARPAPSDRMTIGFVGTGNNGTNWMQQFLRDRRVKVVAVCDVNREGGGYWSGTIRGREPARRMVDQHYGSRDCAAYEDHRKLLARDDIDAIYIGTPDHWHATIAIEAAGAGKHIYGQKPLATSIAEGRRMVQAVGKAGITWQTGSQQRSDPYFKQACAWAREGRLGKIRRVRVGLPGGIPDYGKVADRIQTEAVPWGFNYDRWLGPAPLRPYCPARVGVNFRWVFDYSGGQVTDWGAHHIDIAHLGLDRDSAGPIAIKNAKGTFAPGPVYDTATEFAFEAHYADGVEVLVSSEERMGARFEGDDGWLWVTRGRWDSSDKELLASAEKGIQKQLSKIKKIGVSPHVTNFIEAVLEDATPAAPIETAHRSVAVAHLGNIALRTGRDLRWDPAKEKINDDPGASEMLDRPSRPEWS